MTHVLGTKKCDLKNYYKQMQAHVELGLDSRPNFFFLPSKSKNTFGQRINVEHG
jgi:hypothetical protein